MKTILTNCTVIDCTGQKPFRDTTVVIDDGRISELKSGAGTMTARDDASCVFDLEGGYVLPGLWAVHSHLGAVLPDVNRVTINESTADRTIRAGRHAMEALRAGFTGIRVVGEDSYIDVAWKRAFDIGLFVGPRLFVCGHSIISTGGHGHNLPFGKLEVDGPYEMRKAVREQLKHGVDWIKLCITGGVATTGETAHEIQLCLDEVQAATEVAHMKGKRVCVHSAGADGTKVAIRGGVDCIEHGYQLDDEAIEMMLEHDIYLVPTLKVTQDESFWRKSGRAHVFDRVRVARQAHKEGFQKALAAGVKIATGADSSPIAENTFLEIEHLVKAGMTEMQALVATTRTSAELCGVLDQLGTVEVGKLADLVVLSDNPLEEISNTRKVKMVFKEGNLVDTGASEGLANFWELFWEPR